MTRYIILFFALTCAAPCISQKTSVGTVDTDYLLTLLPGYTSWNETKTKAQMALEQRAENIQKFYVQKLTELDSLQASTSHTRKQDSTLREELTRIETDYTTFIKYAGDSAHVHDSIALAEFNRELRRAEFAAAEKEKCFGIAESKPVAFRETPKGIVYVDITKAVAQEIKSPSPVGAKKRVGVCSYDSLLTLVPGYQAALDSCKVYKKNMDAQLAKMDADITKKEREYDSLYDKSSELLKALRLKQIDEMKANREAFLEMAAQEEKAIESQLLAGTRQRLDNAIAIASRENNCTITYDRDVAHQTWTESEAEFIDLNKAIAPKLK